MLIDSHAHLFNGDYDEDIESVIRRAGEAEVGFCVVPGTDLATSRQAVELAERFPGVFAAVGYHPLDLAGISDAGLTAIEELSHHPKVVAIGEIGVDYFYDKSPRSVQLEMFRRQIALAIRRDLPVIIHTRDSMADTVALVKEVVTAHPEWRRNIDTGRGFLPRGVFHCYSGDAATAYELIRSGFLISFTGSITFKNSSASDVLAAVGYDHIMLETDAPFMAPVPYRGKRNEPSHLPLIAAKVAEVCHATMEDVVRTTTFNAKRLFSLGEPDAPVFTYQLGKSLYINLTNRCNADCVFCDRKGEAVVKGHNLKITREPEAMEVIDQIGDPLRYDEIVFCGYGEPAIRLEVLKEISASVKQKGGRIRLNTDGHGNVIHKRNILPELEGLVDSVSVSLNSVDPVQYGELMRLDGPKYHAAMLEFIREAKKFIPNVVVSVVGMSDVDQSRARELVEKELGVTFRVRPYF